MREKLKIDEFEYEFTPNDSHKTFRNCFWIRKGDYDSISISFNELDIFEEVITKAIKKAREFVKNKDSEEVKGKWKQK